MCRRARCFAVPRLSKDGWYRCAKAGGEVLSSPCGWLFGGTGCSPLRPSRSGEGAGWKHFFRRSDRASRRVTIAGPIPTFVGSKCYKRCPGWQKNGLPKSQKIFLYLWFDTNGGEKKPLLRLKAAKDCQRTVKKCLNLKQFTFGHRNQEVVATLSL